MNRFLLLCFRGRVGRQIGAPQSASCPASHALMEDTPLQRAPIEQSGRTRSRVVLMSGLGVRGAAPATLRASLAPGARAAAALRAHWRRRPRRGGGGGGADLGAREEGHLRRPLGGRDSPLFEQFKQQYHGATTPPLPRRRSASASNLKHIDALNKRNPLALFGVTKAADRTEAERAQAHGRRRGVVGGAEDAAARDGRRARGRGGDGRRRRAGAQRGAARRRRRTTTRPTRPTRPRAGCSRPGTTASSRASTTAAGTAAAGTAGTTCPRTTAAAGTAAAGTGAAAGTTA